MAEKKSVTVRIDEVLYGRLAALARSRERSMSFVMQKAIEEFMDNNDEGQLELKLK